MLKRSMFIGKRLEDVQRRPEIVQMTLCSSVARSGRADVRKTPYEDGRFVILLRSRNA
jgi:hypothetical protein